jgi:glutamine synthetase
VALEQFEGGTEIRELLGEEFCRLYHDIKRAEYEEYQREISPWERQHLLLNA